MNWYLAPWTTKIGADKHAFDGPILESIVRMSLSALTMGTRSVLRTRTGKAGQGRGGGINDRGVHFASINKGTRMYAVNLAVMLLLVRSDAMEGYIRCVSSPISR